MKRNRGPCAAFARAALVGVAIAFSAVADAAPFTWDAAGGAPLNDGSGAWNATGGTNWFDGTTYGAWGNTSADTATFGVASGAAGTVTVGNVTVNAITFDTPGSGNYTLSSGTITMAGTSPTMTVNASGTTTISSILAGSDNWTKSGTGTLLLSNGATTFSITGTTTVNAGILALNGPNSATGLLGNSAGFIVNNGGTIRVDSLNAFMGWSNTNLKPVTLNAGGLLTLSDGQSAHIGGVLTLAGGTLGGSSAAQWGGWWLDNATTTITENSTISGANVVLSNATANNFDVAAGKTLLVSGNFGYGSSGNGLNGKLTKIGTGTMTLAGGNAYIGTTSVNAGTLQIGNNGTAGSIAAASAVTGSAGGVLAFNRTDNYGGNFSNTVSGGLALTINSGTIALTGTNTFTGVTTLNAGVVNLGSAETAGTSGPLGASAAANAGNIVLAGGTLQYSASNANDYSGRFSTASNQRYNIDTNSRSVTFATLLSSTGGSLTKLGSGTLALSAANTYTGTTTPSAGTLRLDNNLALQNSVLNTSGGGSLALGSGITTPTIGGLAGSTNLATAFGNWPQATALTLNPLSGTTTYTGVIAEGAVGTTLTKTGPGTQVLQSASSYTFTGTTTVNGGVLAVNGPNTPTGLLGNSAGFVINNGGTIRLESWNALMGYTNAKPVTVNAGGLLTMPDGNTAWIRGPLTLAGGTLAGGFNGAYGGWILGNGTTTVTENSAITATNVVLSNESANVFDVVAGKTLAVTGYFGWGSDASSKRNGNLTKSGAGTMSLIVANFYTGTTTINGGVLAVGGSNSTTFGVLGRSAGFVINDGGTLRVETDNALMGFDATNTKPVTINAGGLLTINGVTAHIAGVLTLAGGTLAGTPSGQWGGWWLDNTTTNVTENSTIGAGNVVLTATTSNGFDVAAGKTLLVTGNFGYGSSTIGLNGRLTKLGSGTMTLAGANTYTGTTAINAGTLQIGNSGTTGSLAASTGIVIASGATLAFNRTDAYGGNFANTISGSGSVALISGSLTFSTAKTYSGQTRVSGGTLTLGAADTISSQSSLLVDGGGFNLAGFNDTVGDVTITSGSIYGSGTLAGSSYALQGGALNAVLGSGAVTVSTGTTTLGSAGRLNSASSVTISSGQLTLGGNETVGGFVLTGGILAGSGNTLTSGSAYDMRSGSVLADLGGAVGLLKSTEGVVVLTGNNTFTGLTTISGGTLSVGNGGTTGALAGNVLNNAALVFNRSDDSTYAGNVSGSGNLTKLGGGKLTLTGSSSYAGATTVSNGVLAVNGRITSSVDVAGGAALGGSGKIAGNVGGDGLIAPGNSPGILTVTGQLDSTEITAFAFELSQPGAPAWNNASSSVNDVLRLTATSPFTTSLASTNAINVYFDVTSLANGDTFLGGFFVDNPNSTTNMLATGLGSAVFNYFVKGDGEGLNSYNGTSYYTLAEYIAAHSEITSVTQSVVSVASANFADGTITTGQVTQFVVVPEPGAVIVAGIGVAMSAWALRKRRRGPLALR